MSVYEFLNQLFPNEGLRVFMINELVKLRQKTIPHRKIYVLCGEGSNGKTTFLNFVIKLVACKVVWELGEDDELFWEAINQTIGTNIPIFLAVHSTKELDILSSSELWEHACIIPMDSTFVHKENASPDKFNYPRDEKLYKEIPTFVNQFVVELCSNQS